jgi:hypothetical protein
MRSNHLKTIGPFDEGPDAEAHARSSRSSPDNSAAWSLVPSRVPSSITMRRYVLEQRLSSLAAGSYKRTAVETAQALSESIEKRKR